jgi:hypothetical protein
MPISRSPCTFIINSRRFVTDVLPLDEPSTHADKQIAMQIHHRCSSSRRTVDACRQADRHAHSSSIVADSSPIFYHSTNRRRMPTSRSPCKFIIDVHLVDKPSTHADKQIAMHIHHRCSSSRRNVDTCRQADRHAHSSSIVADSSPMFDHSTNRRRMPTSRSPCKFIIDVHLVDLPSTHADKQIDMQIHHRCSSSRLTVDACRQADRHAHSSSMFI